MSWLNELDDRTPEQIIHEQQAAAVARCDERQAIVEFLTEWLNNETHEMTIQEAIDLIESGKYL